MRHIPIAEFKDRVSEFVAAAESGEDITITRHGREVAKVIGMDGDRAARQRAALAEILTFRDSLRKQGVSIAADDWIAWKGEGRR